MSCSTLTCATREELAGGSGCCGGGSCCGPATLEVDDLAEQIGYSRDELEALPGGANMGLSCGNPTAIAQLSAGEVVMDLGSGGGFDVFLAGPKVGASGREIGVDMTAEMMGKVPCHMYRLGRTPSAIQVSSASGPSQVKVPPT